jgi:putative alpha-1,2-mannosidase
MGFYPACPAEDNYRIGSPIFEKITIQLDRNFYPSSQIIIEREVEQYEKVFLNGIEIIGFNINHSDLVKGGRLIFTK